MKPDSLVTKIFLDGGDPTETKQIIGLLGFLDGQTTNPTLIAKNPEVKARLEKVEKFSAPEIYEFYQSVVKELSDIIPGGSISIEVYADADTTTEAMLAQARKMYSWIPNAHIKFPTTKKGLIAAERAVQEGMRVNMTLCFSQQQAAAVYAATRGAKKGQVFVSPFVGRLDDKEENGMDLIKNILQMYCNGDGHVEVLTASVRTLDHFMYALLLGSSIVTAPGSVLKKWSENGLSMPHAGFIYNTSRLKPIYYQELDLEKPWQDFNIFHELTNKGLERFSSDWNSLTVG